MLPNVGLPELIIIMAILLLVFGAGRLPQIGEGIGKAIRNLKRGLNTDDDIEITPTDKQVSHDSAASKRSEEADVAEHKS